MKKVKLPSRYKEENYLEEIEENRYLLKTSCSYTRFGYKDDGTYTFVDPSGGPFMHVGNEVEGCGKLVKIEANEKGTILTFDSNDLSSNTESGTV